MSGSRRIRHALPDEARHLSDLALRSKGFWGYSGEFLESCRAELTVDEDRIRDDDYPCYVAVDNDIVVGFYALEPVSATVLELQALFVDPQHIGHGFGRLLIQHALRTAAKRGAASLLIQGDPHATDFYLATGARPAGTRETGSIPGRVLPLFEIDVTRVGPEPVSRSLRSRPAK